METYYYDVELRDKDGKLYQNSHGMKLTSNKFSFSHKTDIDFIELVCQTTADNYKTVCKEGTEINISVRTFNELTKTYPLAYSFYAGENKFIKH